VKGGVTVGSKTRNGRIVRSIALVASLATMVGLTAGPAGADEVDISSFFNNVGITQDPTSGADFDGGGYSYSSLAMQLGDPINNRAGIEPGDQITVEGATFTWPDTASGANDNIASLGQTVPVPETPGATKLAFLGASTNGPSTGTFGLKYSYTDDEGEHTVTVPTPVTVSDWTLNAGASQPAANNTIALRSLFRMSGGLTPERVVTNVFVVTVPLDPTMTLESVKLPLFSAGQIHIFSLAVVGGTDEEE
jgi:hypothetical protein